MPRSGHGKIVMFPPRFIQGTVEHLRFSINSSC